MAQAARAVRRGTLTYRDLWHTPDEGNRYEIIDWEVYVSPAPYVSHQRAAFNLAVILCEHIERRRLGQVFIAPIAVILEKPSGVRPDVV